MKLEINRAAIPEMHPSYFANLGSLATPAVADDVWLARVQLSATQALVAVPHFMTLAIRFEREEAWHALQLFTLPTASIWENIQHNKEDDSIKDGDCISAIQLLKDACEKLAPHQITRWKTTRAL